ncbi:MAG: hypothetical protein R3230_00290 [Nitrosopumilaceae archaeon]|nr:hypothetical protein [Nitrosopumilaceae archaeon]
MDKFTERDIQLLISDKFCFNKKHELIVPNITTLHDFWEADLVSMTKSFFLHEFEIKTTRSDWLKEYRIIAEGRNDGCKFRRAVALHKQFNSDTDLGSSPNYFWVCAPSGVVKDDELPSYAGMIEVYRFRKVDRLKIIKPAPRLHSGKCSDKMIASMYRSLNFKFWNMRKK